jgi:hypothetical protein
LSSGQKRSDLKFEKKKKKEKNDKGGGTLGRKKN